MGENMFYFDTYKTAYYRLSYFSKWWIFVELVSDLFFVSKGNLLDFFFFFTSLQVKRLPVLQHSVDYISF